MLHAVIMAGGSGTRFWPQSRLSRPKQLLPLVDAETMIQSTAARCGELIPAARTWVVTNAVQAEQAREQLPDVPAGQVLVEPVGRNTAPCIGLAALEIIQADPDGVMLVMPADHVIRSVDRFQHDVRLAVAQVEQEPDRLVLFGVKPDYPSIGFGYIERAADPVAEGCIYDVTSFREKPSQEVAREYLAAGNYYWNCGIFVWKAATVLDAIAEFEPELGEGLNKLRAAMTTPDWPDILQRDFGQLKSISIDYAVLERSSRVQVLEASYDWDDVGSWNALARLLGTDSDGNTIVGDACVDNSSGCIIRSSNDHLLAVGDVEDLIVVHTADVTLVVHKGDENAVKRLVEQLRARGRTDVL